MRRRRFLTIAGAAGLVAASPARAFRLDPVEWRGVALGAPARIIIHHENRAEALRLAETCAAEIERLERIFSLYRPDSALTRLNRTGSLADPPLDLLVLMGEADKAWRRSGGAFDPTVQPLWDLYAAHFSRPGVDPAGPPAAAIEATMDRVGWGQVQFSPQSVALPRPGMALTFNGIAQGYVTDRIAALLRGAGLRDVLVDMGEIAASGGPWRIGLPDGRTQSLSSGALAVSSLDGTRFSPLCHHIFDPQSGRCATPGKSWTVQMAETAVDADGLATAALVREG